MYLPATKWSWSFPTVAFVQAVVILAFESYVFAMFQIDLKDSADTEQQTTTIPTFLALYIFGFIYQLVLVYDALRLKNTIQVIGLVLLNVGLLIYGAVQYDTLDDAVRTLKNHGDLKLDIWDQVRPFLIAIPCVLALGTLLLGFLAWKLYDEFAWTIYKHISADLKMKRRYLVYQIFIALLKFDFFFFLGFTIQFVVIVRGRDATEFGLTIAAIPITIMILIAAAYATRRENRIGMIAAILFFFAGMAYFVFKLSRIYTHPYEQAYQPARKELATFAVITIILIILTIINAIMCFMNFNQGLRPYVSTRKVESDEEKFSHLPVRPKDYNLNSDGSANYGGYGYGQSVEMQPSPYQGRPGPRMEID